MTHPSVATLLRRSISSNRRPVWDLDQSEAKDIIQPVRTEVRREPQPALWRDRDQRSPEDPERLLLDAIAEGELDEHLVALADAIHARRELLHTVRSATALAQLCVGDAVRINRNVRPQYLYGEHGVIIDRDDRGVTVRLLRPIGRFRSGEIHCPPLALDKLGRAPSQTYA